MRNAPRGGGAIKHPQGGGMAAPRPNHGGKLELLLGIGLGFRPYSCQVPHFRNLGRKSAAYWRNLGRSQVKFRRLKQEAQKIFKIGT